VDKEKVMQTVKKLIVGVLVVLGLLAVIGMIMNAVDPQEDYTITDEARATSARNAFVSGCTDEGGDFAMCGCAYDELLALYPDFATNETRMNRIVESGYNSIETDAVIKCVSTKEV